MPTETMNSSSYFNNLMRYAQDHHLSPTAPSTYDAPPAQKRPSIVIENEDTSTMYPPLKRMRMTPIATANTPFHRLPCKARGMSNKHNSETAFIDVPINALHGMLLSCSNIECAYSGRKFRYCKVCAIPVAKRNFPKRHGHGLIHFAKDLKEVDYMSTLVVPSNVPDMTCQPCDASDNIAPPQLTLTMIEQPRLHRRTVSVDQSKQQQRQQQVGYSHDEVYDDHQQQMMMSPQPVPVVERSSTNRASDEEDWLSLLRERPNLDEQDEMSKWMDKVIQFSSDASSTPPVQQNEAQETMYIPVTPPSSPDMRSASVTTPPAVVAPDLSSITSSIDVVPSDSCQQEAVPSSSSRRASVYRIQQLLETIDENVPVFDNDDMMRFFNDQ